MNELNQLKDYRDDFAVQVVGWGIMEEADSRNQANVLQEPTLPVQSYEGCYLEEQNFFSKNLVPGLNFCAGDPKLGNYCRGSLTIEQTCILWLVGKVTCQGDSRGGFTIKRNGKWFLRGVVSFGNSKIVQNNKRACGENVSSLFVDVTGYAWTGSFKRSKST